MIDMEAAKDEDVASAELAQALGVDPAANPGPSPVELRLAEIEQRQSELEACLRKIIFHLDPKQTSHTLDMGGLL